MNSSVTERKVWIHTNLSATLLTLQDQQLKVISICMLLSYEESSQFFLSVFTGYCVLEFRQIIFQLCQPLFQTC